MHPDSLRGDIEWYCRKAVASGGPVLELGAGTGRIALAVAQAGIRITASDLDEGMLEKLARKKVSLPEDVQSRISMHRADMRSVTLDDRFALVIIPFRAFLHNLTWDDQLAALRRAFDHLKPGGELAFNVFHPSLEFMAANAGAQAGVWRARDTQRLPSGGFVVYSDSLQVRHGSPAGVVVDSHGRVRQERIAGAYSRDGPGAGVPLSGRHQAPSRALGVRAPADLRRFHRPSVRA